MCCCSTISSVLTCLCDSVSKRLRRYPCPWPWDSGTVTWFVLLYIYILVSNPRPVSVILHFANQPFNSLKCQFFSVLIFWFVTSTADLSFIRGLRTSFFLFSLGQTGHGPSYILAYFMYLCILNKILFKSSCDFEVILPICIIRVEVIGFDMIDDLVWFKKTKYKTPNYYLYQYKTPNSNQIGNKSW